MVDLATPERATIASIVTADGPGLDEDLGRCGDDGGAAAGDAGVEFVDGLGSESSDL